jgi:tRNA nucleotidyltransferase/poly(A) polymerase
MAALDALWQRGHAAYLVGGGVRDALLGRSVTDWDVATDARPERILEVFPGSTYTNRFGTVQARGLEITTFRREHRYADHRRPDSVTFSDDVYEDLARRDLTINAIAWGSRSRGSPSRLVDPADGRGDLRAGLVRAVGDPRQRFDEDALRLLRAVRIAARLDFRIEPVTLAAMCSHAADLRWVSEERVAGEVLRMLEADRPSKAFRLLRGTGMLMLVLPELDSLAGRHDVHAADGEDGLDRSLRTLDAVTIQTPGRTRLALAALLCEAGPVAARAALDRLRVAARLADAVTALIEAAAITETASWSDADVRRYMASVAPGLLDDLLALRGARVAPEDARNIEREQILARRVQAQHAAGAPLSLADLEVDGRDVRDTLGIPEGPAIGRVLDRLLRDVIEDPALNQRMTLLTRARLLSDELGDELGDRFAEGNEDDPGQPRIG